MIGDGNQKHIVNDSLEQPDSDHQYPIGTEKTFTGMEGSGRVSSGLYRNTSEEMFLKSFMESSIGVAAPSMESMGFKNLSLTLRGDSEELFNSWLLNGENHGYSSSSIAHRTRQASRRISTELAVISSHQHGGAFQKTCSNDNLFQPNFCGFDNLSSDINQHAVRDGLERGLQATDLYLAKAWLQSSQPMTRSRSSELRRKYAAMQSIQSSPGMAATQSTTGRCIHGIKQDFASADDFGGISAGETLNPCNFGGISARETLNQFSTFTSPSNSSTTPFSTPPMANVDTVSTVVSMLKGTLERKKLCSSHNGKENDEGGSFTFYGAQEVLGSLNSDQGPGNQNPEALGTFQVLSHVPVKDSQALQAEEGSLEMDINGFVAPANPIQMATVSQEPSQSESSAAAPVLSTGFEICDGPANSGQTISVCESSMRHAGNGNSEHSSKTKEFRERIFENNYKDDPKRGNLVRMGSVTSGGSVDKGDPTKKRRVERSRKMAEAKEKSQSPSIPSDMQSILKRCEALEKEVRSLKLNLSFMNRKDSEQTKQIEELQKQNEELMDEKERLLEEIEKILVEPGKV